MPRASPPHLQIGHDVRRASRTPSHRSRAQARGGFRAGWLSSPFHGEGDPRSGGGAPRQRRCVDAKLYRPGAHAPAPSTPPSPRLWRAHFPTKWGRKTTSAFPGFIPGSGGVSGGGSAGPRHGGRGKRSEVEEKEGARETPPPATGPGDAGLEKKRSTRRLQPAARWLGGPATSPAIASMSRATRPATSPAGRGDTRQHRAANGRGAYRR